MRPIVTVVIAVAAGFAGAGLWDVSGLGDRSTRAYLLSNPEVLPEAMDVLTLVEFSDYACTYCRQSRDDVDALIAANPDLKVVIREYPILRPESLDAARMALAAAQQGKYAAFHDAMFRLGPPSAETIEAAARQAGVDLALARATIDSGALDAQLHVNAALASQLGITGTPGWVVGDRLFNGAVGQETIGEAIAEVRRS